MKQQEINRMIIMNQISIMRALERIVHGDRGADLLTRASESMRVWKLIYNEEIGLNVALEDEILD